MSFWHVIGFVPCAFAIGAVVVWARCRVKWKGARPFKDKLLRAPGEALREKIQELDETVLWPMFALAISGLALGAMTEPATKLSDPLRTQFLLALWAAGCIAIVLSTWWLVNLLRTRLDYTWASSGSAQSVKNSTS